MKRFLLGCSALALLAAAGCAWFEEMTSKHEDKTAAERRERKKTSRTRRDPVNDMFLGVGKRAETPSFVTGGLNDTERSVVEDEMRRQDDDIKAMRRYHRNFDSERGKRREWVYSFKTW